MTENTGVQKMSQPRNAYLSVFEKVLIAFLNVLYMQILEQVTAHYRSKNSTTLLNVN
jgi:hypothetical protein